MIVRNRVNVWIEYIKSGQDALITFPIAFVATAFVAIIGIFAAIVVAITVCLCVSYSKRL